MKKFLTAGILFLLTVITISSGCDEKRHISQENLIKSEGTISAHIADNSVTVPIDVEKSIIKWRGTKLGGIRGHEGILKFERGALVTKEDIIVGGSFIVNMNFLEVTDIPDEQATAKNNLKDHLKSEFKTTVYPQSKFEITNVKNNGPGEVHVWGNLTIRGVTKNVQTLFKIIGPKESGKMITADINLDRSAWNIGEDGSWLEKRVVDNEFNIKITLEY